MQKLLWDRSVASGLWSRTKKWTPSMRRKGEHPRRSLLDGALETSHTAGYQNL
jgi:hypothetical protein